MSRVLHCSLSLDRSPQSVRGRCLSGEFADPKGRGPAGGGADPADDAGSGPDESANTAAIEECRKLLAAVEESVLTAETARRHSLDEFQQLAIELAVIIAGELVFRTIDADQFDVAGMVEAAVERLGLDTPLTVTLHPLDVQLLESQAAAADEPAVWRTDALTLRPDASLPRGHCRAANGATALLSELAPRLEEIRESLLEGLDDAEIERRQTAGLGSQLKRFPDRRETA